MRRIRFWYGLMAGVGLLVGGCSGYEPDDYDEANGIGDLKLTVADSVLPADGASVSAVVASVPKDQAGRIGKLKFTVVLGALRELGTAGPGDLALSDSGFVRASLVAGTTEGTGRVQVETNGLVRSIPVRFARAWPDSILVVPASFSLKSGIDQSATVEVRLLRRVGTPTQGIRATMTAFDSTGAPIGLFDAGSASDNTGKILVHFTGGATAYRGRMTLVASVDTVGGQMTGSGRLDLVP